MKKHDLIRPFEWARCNESYRWVTGTLKDASREKTATVLVPNAEAMGPDARPQAYTAYTPDPDVDLFFVLAATPATEEGILGFASAYGLLGLKPEKVMTEHGVVRTGETLAGWKWVIGELNYAVERWAAARGNVTLAGDEPGFGWIDLGQALNQHLRQGTALEMTLTEKKGTKPPKKKGVKSTTPPEFRRHDLQLVAQNLLGYLWLRLALAIDAGSQFKRCPACQRMLAIRPLGKRATQLSCSDACRARLAYYRKLSQEGRMSLAEIAKRVGSDVPAVREWVKKPRPKWMTALSSGVEGRATNRPR
jgi:hypothetical protein